MPDQSPSNPNRQTVDNPETADHSPIKKPVTVKLARADFFNERMEISPPRDSTLNSPQQGGGKLPKQSAG
jgi:hypothetical protein